VACSDSVWAVFRTHEEVRIPDSPRPEFPNTVSFDGPTSGISFHFISRGMEAQPSILP
jgi:hypothetical protein